RDPKPQPPQEAPMAQLAEKRETRPAAGNDAVFNWEDPLDLESELTEEERMVRDTARGYAQDKLFPRVLLDNREERFDRAIVSEMGARSEERRVGKEGRGRRGRGQYK